MAVTNAVYRAVLCSLGELWPAEQRAPWEGMAPGCGGLGPRPCATQVPVLGSGHQSCAGALAAALPAQQGWGRVLAAN